VLLALVPNHHNRFFSSGLEEENTSGKQGRPMKDELFGAYFSRKKENVLCIGFQNIGGLPLYRNKLKDDAIRCGITAFDFDIFGLAEVNTDWRLQTKEIKLHERRTGWWESLHISYSHNTTTKPLSMHQWEGTAIFSINKAAHRAAAKGYDPSTLGRRFWTRFQGRNNKFLRIYSGY